MRLLNRRLYRVRKAIFLPVALFVVVVLRALSGVFQIVFVDLNSKSMGNFTMISQFFLWEIENITCKKNNDINIVYASRNCANKYVSKKIRELIRVHSFGYEFLNACEYAIRLIGGKRHPLSKGDDSPCFNRFHPIVSQALERPKQYLYLSDTECAVGLKWLDSIGVPPNAKMVTLAVRDRAYGRVANLYYDDGNWYRNSEISNYESAAFELAERGYYVFRMGAAVEKPLKCNHPKVIDYAFRGLRTDFLDVFIFSKTTFHVGTASGVDFIPTMFFQKPWVITNLHTFDSGPTVLFPNTIMISKKIRYQSLNGQVKEELPFKLPQGLIDEQLIENTPEEIRAAVIEMEERLRRVWVEPPESKQLQKIFADAYFRAHPDREINILSMLSYDFASKNKVLLIN